MVFTFDYDSSYPNGPSMPVIELEISAVGETRRGIVVTAMVDSGADATIIPVSILEQAGVELVGRARMRWGHHSGSTYEVYLATIRIGNFDVNGVRILADKDHDEIVVGRDVLNHLEVLLNGPAGVVQIFA